jgi:hypothetical protein
MRASEFLRSLANTLAALETGVDTPGQSSGAEQPVDDNVGEFTPPLQTKIELLKKANNVKSVYDQNGEPVNMSGRPNASTQEASEDDGPFE